MARLGGLPVLSRPGVIAISGALALTGLWQLIRLFM
jgi:hypothetical protein